MWHEIINVFLQNLWRQIIHNRSLFHTSFDFLKPVPSPQKTSRQKWNSSLPHCLRWLSESFRFYGPAKPGVFPFCTMAGRFPDAFMSAPLFCRQKSTKPVKGERSQSFMDAPCRTAAILHRPSIVLGNNILVTFYRQQDTLSIDRKSDYRLINFV